MSNLQLAAELANDSARELAKAFDVAIKPDPYHRGVFISAEELNVGGSFAGLETEALVALQKGLVAAFKTVERAQKDYAKVRMPELVAHVDAQLARPPR